jgi:hypothetical protein
MALIQELYKPELAFLPIGDCVHHEPARSCAGLPSAEGSPGNPAALRELFRRSSAGPSSLPNKSAICPAPKVLALTPGVPVQW